MPKLSDTQLVILSAAARRQDSAVLPLPRSLKVNKAVATTVLKSLLKKGLLKERPAAADAAHWQETRDGGRTALVITDTGLQAIGVDVDRKTSKQSSSTKPKGGTSPAAVNEPHWRKSKDGGRRALVITEDGLQAIGVDADKKTSKQSRSAKQKPKQRSLRAERKPCVAKPSPAAVRPGTKQALLIDLLKRKKGATIDEAIEATGWQPHSVRGAISGALKKKLGLAVTSERVEKRGRVYRIVERG